MSLDTTSPACRSLHRGYCRAHAALPSSPPVLGVKPQVQPAQTAAGDEAAPLPHRLPSPSPAAGDPLPDQGQPSRVAAGSAVSGGRPRCPTPPARGRGAFGEVVPVTGAIHSGTAGVWASLEGSGLHIVRTVHGTCLCVLWCSPGKTGHYQKPVFSECHQFSLSYMSSQFSR